MFFRLRLSEKNRNWLGLRESPQTGGKLDPHLVCFSSPPGMGVMWEKWHLQAGHYRAGDEPGEAIMEGRKESENCLLFLGFPLYSIIFLYLLKSLQDSEPCSVPQDTITSYNYPQKVIFIVLPLIYSELNTKK